MATRGEPRHLPLCQRITQMRSAAEYVCTAGSLSGVRVTAVDIESSLSSFLVSAVTGTLGVITVRPPVSWEKYFVPRHRSALQKHLNIVFTVYLSPLHSCVCACCHSNTHTTFRMYRKLLSHAMLLHSAAGNAYMLAQHFYPPVVCLQVDIARARFNVPPNTLQVISGTSFYGSNDPTNSVKALKIDRS